MSQHTDEMREAFERWQDEYIQTSEYIECRTVEVRKAWDASYKAAATRYEAALREAGDALHYTLMCGPENALDNKMHADMRDKAFTALDTINKLLEVK